MYIYILDPSHSEYCNLIGQSSDYIFHIIPVPKFAAGTNLLPFLVIAYMEYVIVYIESTRTLM